MKAGGGRFENTEFGQFMGSLVVVTGFSEVGGGVLNKFKIWNRFFFEAGGGRLNKYKIVHLKGHHRSVKTLTTPR